MTKLDEDNMEVKRDRFKTWKGLLIAGLIFALAWVVWGYQFASKTPAGWAIGTKSYSSLSFIPQSARFFRDTDYAMSPYLEEDEVHVMRPSEIRWLGRQKRLAKLFFRRCDLRGLNLSGLRELNQLRTLNFSQVQLTEEQLALLLQLPNLEYVGIDETAISGDALASLISNSKMKRLGLRGVDLSLQTLESISAMKHLKELALTDIVMNNAERMPITQLEQLTKLTLSGVKIKDTELTRLVAHPKLKELSLHDVNVSTRTIESIGEVGSLKIFMIDGVEGDDERLISMRPLAQLGQLTLLRFSGVVIGDAGLIQLARLPKLESLMLSSAGVTGQGVWALDQHPSLTILALDLSIIEGHHETLKDFIAQNPKIRFNASYILKTPTGEQSTSQ